MLPGLREWRPPLWIAVGSLFIWSLFAPVESWAQAVPFEAMPDEKVAGDGWAGFLRLGFLLNFLLSLLLAAFLGALIAYHPKRYRKRESVQQLEAPRLFVMYAVVGAVIGAMVVEYGLVIGFVIFGLGGLMRFRTNVGPATRTGRVILVTLVGLSSGLNLPHVAVLSTLFGYGLIYLLDRQVAYRIEVKGITPGEETEAARIYRTVLEQAGCEVISERKNLAKHRVMLFFLTSHNVEHEELEELLENEVPESFKGVVDWEMS